MTANQRLRATFDAPDAAEAAMLRLEALGIDAHDVHLATSPSVATPEGARATDLRVTSKFAQRYGVGALAGAVVGVVLMFVMLLLVGFDVGIAAAIAAFAGGVGGFLLGGFWGVASRLPVNTEAIDTASIERADDSLVAVEVHVTDADTRTKVDTALRDAGALSVDAA